MVHVRLITAMIAAIYGISAFAAEQSPFADALTVWHMAGLKDAAGKNPPLTGNATVAIGIELSGAEKAASLARGGDGRVATFDGGYFDAGQAMAKELESKGEQFTLCARLRDPTGNWNSPLFSKRGSHATLVYNLFSTDLGQGKILGFELGTERTPGVTQVFVPLATIGEKEWHDIICRYDGATLQLFIDGVWMDEGFPMGPLRKGNHEPVLIGAESDAGAIRAGWHGLIDHIAIWTRPLADAEITTLSGGANVVAAKKAQYRGASFSKSGEKYRPQFHFTAPKGWLNDPNGLVYENGEWHLFYQHNPNGTNWVSELFWGHAVSKDLLHWNHLPEALPPMPTPAGKVAGSWSGTGFIDFNNSAGFKTGDEPPMVLVWTAVGVGQCLAYSNDHGRTFVRYEKNPVVAMDPPKSDDWDRDPRVFWHEPTQKWVMVFSISGKGMIFYTSRDLKTWEKQTLFAGLWECPDIFELPVDGKAGDKKWIIWDAAGKYFIGQFDGREFYPESGPFILDHGSSYYAAQTWSNTPASRHVGIGWMREGKFPGMPFNQQMGIPFELSLRNTPDGARLTKTPIKEVESLRYDTKEWKDLDLDRNHNPLAQIDGKADTLDIEAEIETRNASEVVLKVRGNTLRLTPDLLWLNNSAAPLRPIAGKITLRVLVDRTSVEVFANNGLVSLSASYLPPDDEKKRDKPPELYAEHGIAKINWMRVHRLKSAL